MLDWHLCQTCYPLELSYYCYYYYLLLIVYLIKVVFCIVLEFRCGPFKAYASVRS